MCIHVVMPASLLWLLIAAYATHASTLASDPRLFALPVFTILGKVAAVLWRNFAKQKRNAIVALVALGFVDLGCAMVAIAVVGEVTPIGNDFVLLCPMGFAGFFAALTFSNKLVEFVELIFLSE
jgi:hypothetical protein